MARTVSRAAVEAAVRANYDSQRTAMVAADADILGELLTENFTLTHMTGYRQLRAEWLADVRSGQMAYHSIEDVGITVEFTHDDTVDAPVLTARTLTEATIWGGHGVWPLLLEIHFTQVGDGWRASYIVASIW